MASSGHVQGSDTPDQALARIPSELRLLAVSPGSPDPPAAREAPEPPDPSEAAAIRRVQAGDGEAFDLIVRRYMRPAYAVAFRVLGHREDAEDVVQEAFLAALANIGSFDTARRFGPWLYRIVMTRGLNFRKSRSRRAAEPLEDGGVASRDAGPAVAAEQAGLRDTVKSALAQLPERQRMVVQLFELDGFSGAEIAEMLGVSPGTVRWYLHEARQALRRMLAHLQETAG
ncbi:MAG TPA: sigma-70 family RNA polymerase sigma factor [Gemmatimonadales bacterium]|nr:sigma-70 family RNA polymerase sigma factor [Gemmatimonadales bacterium]